MIEAPAQLPSLMLRPRPSLSSPPTRSRELPLALDSNLLLPSVRPPSPDLHSAIPQIHPMPDPVARLPATAGPRALRSASRVVTAPPGHAPWQRATAPSPTDGATRSRPALLQGPLPKLLPLPGDDKAIEEAVGGLQEDSTAAGGRRNPRSPWVQTPTDATLASLNFCTKSCYENGKEAKEDTEGQQLTSIADTDLQFVKTMCFALI